MPPVGFEPTISGDERPQTYALDRSATGTGSKVLYSGHNLTSYLRDGTGNTRNSSRIVAVIIVQV